MSKSETNPTITDFLEEIVHLDLPIHSETSSVVIAKSNMSDRGTILVVMGASGDLARKSIYPALWSLYMHDLLPANTFIVGFARSKISIADILDKAFSPTEQEHAKFPGFSGINFYEYGSYSDAEESLLLSLRFDSIEEHFRQKHLSGHNRIFYVALPPSVYQSVTTLIKQVWMAPGEGKTTLVLEKPFGTNLGSCDELSDHLSDLFQSEQIRLVDHYLWLEMTGTIMTVRSVNSLFSQIWDKNFISSVLISFKEDFGTQGRGGYFDKSGIIRDVMQNHLLQLLCVVAMEIPCGCSQESAIIEKSKLLEAISPIDPDEVVLGQYIGNSDREDGYLDDPTVPDDSLTPTFATIVFHINNDRWKGVPFIMTAGKALNETKDEIRIQFKSSLMEDIGLDLKRNELVFQIKPVENVAMNVIINEPGLSPRLIEDRLSLDLRKHFSNHRFPDAYENLFAHLLGDGQSIGSFVGAEELRISWEIFSPLLEKIESEQWKPIPYKFGSSGPVKAGQLIQAKGFKGFETHLL
ncbi:hypothetical protein TCAL_02648 [Tigriopus californicus]|uniref:Glucose-6-phosphate 1-dehydrogenase n=1 Tax=Tigriopus californicus TaxID=6832 RepID=A0A553ND86_TIGCA|nr:glucose-6-phosphate 1-dehydrogenase-like [Tigriopus californicus]TRY63416.1 hypothetical protein TCAL_02648 [Tigriopus californicus]|eukprot:TCALIF_02648-PA protein Name:"Similar to G6PD Glucose-6-phosphate 1-dehydrogenase (Homo sapiens)" AED:0.01 eAED:0.01 QI:0/-1/0/1/-1/1/1/0/522